MLSDETMMPDGRPLFAWRNEIEMLRQREADVKVQRQDFERRMKVLNVVEMQRFDDCRKSEMVIRVKFADMVVAPRSEGAFEAGLATAKIEVR